MKRQPHQPHAPHHATAASVHPELVAMLRCPENRAALRLADASLLAALNRAIEAGRLNDRSGKTVDRHLVGALIRDDDAVCYPIHDGMPRMLADDGIPLDQLRRR